MNTKTMILISALVFLFYLQPEPTVGQGRFSSVGLEVQAYPAGAVVGAGVEWKWNEQNALNVRLGYNITRRGNFGEHDNEEGGGPGFSMGYRRYLDRWLPDLFIGARTDLWLMGIEWRDDNPLETGSTEISVVQPTVEAGFDLLKPRSALRIVPAISFGYEINVKTEGEEVGEGAILLGGISLHYRF